jgi:hypothetical protein
MMHGEPMWNDDDKENAQITVLGYVLISHINKRFGISKK